MKSANLLLQWETVRLHSARTLGANGEGGEGAKPPKPRRTLNCKVADFGLSRLMNTAATHVSLKPEGESLQQNSAAWSVDLDVSHKIAC